MNWQEADVAALLKRRRGNKAAVTVQDDRAESEIQIEAVRWLNYAVGERAVFFHPANGEKRSKRTAGKLKAMGVLPGVPDLQFLWGGPDSPKAAGMEFKRPGGRRSQAQRAMQKRYEEHGHPYVIVKSLEEVQSWVRAWGLIYS